jgi:hypothetical protein
MEMETRWRRDGEEMETNEINILFFNVGLWKSQDELRKLRKIDKIFTPAMDNNTRTKLFAKWQKGVNLALHWADDESYPTILLFLYIIILFLFYFVYFLLLF